MSADPWHTTVAEDRVSWNQLIAYGMGGLIPIALFNIAGQLMGVLGNISLGLSAFWLGTIMIVPRLWDAVSDPIIGHLSDNTRSRWGRRRPYILIGGIAVALSFVAMWWVPRGDSFAALFPSEAAYNWFQLAYILVGLLLFFTACTVFEIPHGALGMELSGDYHERTRLFSAKSFCGNMFAMGTPWLFALATVFKGPGRDLVDGMRFVSLFVAAVLIPLVWWWFAALREPGFTVAKHQEKSAFWHDMRTALANKTFLSLVVIIFTLAMGFNFVNLFSYYIAIFYLYGGSEGPAAELLGYNGMVWAIAGLLAVFPLNWISRRWGKNRTLLIAILLMCAAQLAKIVCYDPTFPHLIFVPTVLLSAGMLMFFTLGASMVGDICDEDELNTGRRSEGSYYSVYWWFIKVGTAFASFVTGALLVFTAFDQQQNVNADSLRGRIEIIKSDAGQWPSENAGVETRIAKLNQQFAEVIAATEAMSTHLDERLQDHPNQAEHTGRLVDHLNFVRSKAEALYAVTADLATSPSELNAQLEPLLRATNSLKEQAPTTLFRLRAVEIGLPLVLSTISIFLTLRYPLTEARCYEIKESLRRRRAERAPNSPENVDASDP